MNVSAYFALLYLICLFAPTWVSMHRYMTDWFSKFYGLFGSMEQRLINRADSNSWVYCTVLNGLRKIPDNFGEDEVVQWRYLIGSVSRFSTLW